MHMIKYNSLIVACFVALLIGCAGTKQVSKPEPKTEPVSIVVEDFDPTSLNDYEFPFDKSNLSAETPLDIDNFLSGKARADTAKVNRKVPGYRVQLIATRSMTEAQAIRKEALLDFTEYVYLTFDDPYYKVRIGDILTRHEANDLQEVAIARGYVEAWVVRTMVNDHPDLLFKHREEEPQTP